MVARAYTISHCFDEMCSSSRYIFVQFDSLYQVHEHMVSTRSNMSEFDREICGCYIIAVMLWQVWQQSFFQLTTIACTILSQSGCYSTSCNQMAENWRSRQWNMFQMLALLPAKPWPFCLLMPWVSVSALPLRSNCSMAYSKGDVGTGHFPHVHRPISTPLGECQRSHPTSVDPWLPESWEKCVSEHRCGQN